MNIQRRLLVIFVFLIYIVFSSAIAQESTQDRLYRGTPTNPAIEDLVAAVSADSITSYLTTLERFYTRHTLSDTTSSDTGIGATRRWIKSLYQQWSDDAGGHLEPSFFWFSDLICGVTDIHANVNATLPGTQPESAERHFVISGHMDSRNVGACDFDVFAPGTNDDGSGTAASIEIARVMSQMSFDASLIFMCVTGEDQGLFGSTAYADWAAGQGMQIDGMLTNDIIGNIISEEGDVDSTSVRHFSAEPTTSISRQLSRYVKLKGEQYVPDMTVNLIPALDRPGRSGDHVPFSNNGYAAVRFTEPAERFVHQHSDTDILENMSPDYTAQVTRLSVAAFASLALAPATPNAALQVQDVGNGTELFCSWETSNTEPDFDGYRLAWRHVDSLFYQEIIPVGSSTEYTLSGLAPGEGIYISYSATDVDGNESRFSEEVLAIPAIMPAEVGEVEATSTSANVSIDWLANSELDLAGYNLYRVGPGNLVHQIPLPPKSIAYEDSDIDPHSLYQYYLTAVDTDGNESVHSDTVRGQLATHDLGILVIDASKDGNGGPLDPTDEEVDSFYDLILAGFSIGKYWDVSDSAEASRSISDADLGPYSTIVWHTDIRQPPNPISADTAALKKYLQNGGKLILSGWELLFALSGDGQFLKDFDPGSFIYDYLGVDVAQFAVQTDFHGADPLDAAYEPMTVDSAKISIWGGDLIGMETYQDLVDDADVTALHSFRSSSDPPSDFHGLAVSTRNLNTEFGLIAFGFPLFYFPESEASAAIQQALADLGEEVSIDSPAETTDNVPSDFELRQNFPNPFNGTTQISFFVAASAHVTVTVYNVLGQPVQQLTSTRYTAGEYQLEWDGTDKHGGPVATGVYVYRLEATTEEFGGSPLSTQTRKLIYIR